MNNKIYISKITLIMVLMFMILPLIGFEYNITTAAQTTYTNPVLENMADPDVLYHDGNYFIYGTRSNGFEVFYSPDLVNWTRHIEYALKPGADNWGEPWFWAPDVKYRPSDGMFYMNYTAKTRLYVARSKSPLGPFTKHSNGQLLNEWSIDSNYFIDDDGQEYLLYNGPGDAGIFIAKFASDLRTVHSKTYLIGQSTHPEAWVTQSINEGPYMIKRDGIYYLFYSGNGYGSLYAVGYATSQSPMGPFVRSPHNPILSRTNKAQGTGHNSFAFSPDGSELFMVYHTHKSMTEAHPRNTSIDRMEFIPQTNGPDKVVVHGPTTTPQPMPSAVGVPKPKDPVKWVSVLEWNFNANTEGWTAPNHIGGFNWQSGGYVGGNITGNNPYIISPNSLGTNIIDAKSIRIRMKNNTNSNTAKIDFATNLMPNLDGIKAVSFPINPNDSDYTEYTIDISNVSSWRGTLNQLKIVPSTNVTSGAFGIDYIKILRLAKEDDIQPVYGDVNDDGSVTNIDLILLNRYLAGISVVGFNTINADVNADGSITNIDLIILRRYIAGLPVELGP